MEFLTKTVPIAMLCFVISSMLAVGLGLTVPEIIAPLRNIKVVIFALLANFVLMPLVAILIVRILQLDQPLGVALILLGAASGAPFLPKLAGVAKSNLAFAVGLMVLLMVLTVAYMPLVLPLLLAGVSVDALKVARSLLLLMLLPLGVGLVTRSQWPRVADRIRPPLNRISGLSLILLIALQLITNVRNVISLFGTRGLLATVLFLACGVAIGWVLGGANLEAKGVLSLGTAQRNIAAALLVGGQNFDDPRVLVMVAVAAVIGLVTLMPLARFIGGRTVVQRA